MLLRWIVCCQPSAQPERPSSTLPHFYNDPYRQPFAVADSFSKPQSDSQHYTTGNGHRYSDAHPDSNPYLHADGYHKSYPNPDAAALAYHDANPAAYPYPHVYAVSDDHQHTLAHANRNTQPWFSLTQVGWKKPL